MILDEEILKFKQQIESARDTTKAKNITDGKEFEPRLNHVLTSDLRCP